MALETRSSSTDLPAIVPVVTLHLPLAVPVVVACLTAFNDVFPDGIVEWRGTELRGGGQVLDAVGSITVSRIVKQEPAPDSKDE